MVWLYTILQNIYFVSNVVVGFFSHRFSGYEKDL
uniref:Uncharacterized protein n=1 Tax=viral metagenome TaxID=1070528 RepID=A0A6C0DPI3_9ZZZZ